MYNAYLNSMYVRYVYLFKLHLTRFTRTCTHTHDHTHTSVCVEETGALFFSVMFLRPNGVLVHVHRTRARAHPLSGQFNGLHKRVIVRGVGPARISYTRLHSDNARNRFWIEDVYTVYNNIVYVYNIHIYTCMIFWWWENTIETPQMICNHDRGISVTAIREG